MDAQTSLIPNSVQRIIGKETALSHNWPHFKHMDGVVSTEITQGSDTLNDLSLTAKLSIFTVDENSWRPQTILSIEGGGVLGFTSLLLLEKSMNEVGMLE